MWKKIQVLKFVHPVHGNDKTSILNFFDFTSLIHSQIVQKGFKAIIKKFLLSKLFIHTQIISDDFILDFYFIVVIYFNMRLIKSYQKFIIVMHVQESLR